MALRSNALLYPESVLNTPANFGYLDEVSFVSDSVESIIIPPTLKVAAV